MPNTPTNPAGGSPSLEMLSANFAFLAIEDPQLARLGALAERYFRDDPNTCLIKLRQFGERLAQLTAARAGLLTIPHERQVDMIVRLQDERVLPPSIVNLLHDLRRTGNRAAHANAEDYVEALNTLKIARELGIWFHRTFSDASFAAGPFVPPPDPAAATQALYRELQSLRDIAAAAQSQAEQAQLQAEVAARGQLSAEEQAQQEREERAQWERLAADIDQDNARLEAELQELQAKVQSQTSTEDLARIIDRARNAARQLQLDEATTRTIIDQQLREAGWEAHTTDLRYRQGTRPEANRMLAIAEWPTEGGSVDYALFVGLTCVGVVEAKRQNQDVPGALRQAERYARTIKLDAENLPPTGPWPATQGEPFRVPFVFSTNGRPYLRQHETASGIWFRDLRRPKEQSRALQDWFSPKALQEKLQQDIDAAQECLANQPIAFAFPLRDYQRHAIEAVEAALADERRTMLLAMATGSGKTKLAIALLYRLLESKRFRSVCFVVDRNALGEQAFGEFSTTQMVTAKRFADIFEIKGLKTIDPTIDTKIHICTIQSLVRRVLGEDPEKRPPIDQYDLLVVDECHRGYLLDRELSEVELSFRDQEDYLSKYRRVLEYFDAVKIGLTATPALHTREIFGDPVFTYSYREAVLDGFLIDQEPPIQFVTELAAHGIHFLRDETVDVLNPDTGTVDRATLPDEVSFEVEQFNRKVVTRAFNQVVATELAKYIDLNDPAKTLVFAVNNTHADLLVDVLRKAFAEAQGEIPDEAIQKITGVVDDPQTLIRSFRNDEFPKIAVTVDLLTTGIDVPKICHLVFMRRVNSRILYEQMLGRATRRCDEIGKQSFQVYDAVDIYHHLERLTDMKPVAQNPNIPLSDLFIELTTLDLPEQQEEVRDQLVARLRRMVTRMGDQQVADYTAQVGETPKQTLDALLHAPIEQSVTKLRNAPQIAAFFTGLSYARPGSGPLISHHADRMHEVWIDYHGTTRPEDYLEQFTTFVRDNVNKIAALDLVVTRPRDLDRKTLYQLRQLLDQHHFTEPLIQRAWAEARNDEIAASIIGYVRQAALGDPLLPYEDRVRAAMRAIRASQRWSPVQLRWLERIEKQIVSDVVPDVAMFEDEPFKSDGGRKQIEKILGHDAQELMGEIAELIWKKDVA